MIRYNCWCSAPTSLASTLLVKYKNRTRRGYLLLWISPLLIPTHSHLLRYTWWLHIWYKNSIHRYTNILISTPHVHLLIHVFRYRSWVSVNKYPRILWVSPVNPYHYFSDFIINHPILYYTIKPSIWSKHWDMCIGQDGCMIIDDGHRDIRLPYLMYVLVTNSSYREDLWISISIHIWCEICHIITSSMISVNGTISGRRHFGYLDPGYILCFSILWTDT